MRAPWTCAALIAVTGPMLAHAADPAGDRSVLAVLQVRSDEPQSLQDRLLALAEDRLRPRGLSIDRARTRMSSSAVLPAAQTFAVRSAGLAQVDPPSLPFRFELRPMKDSGVSSAIQVTLAVALQKDVPVAARHLPKGSQVTCADIAIERRDVRQLPRVPLTLPCDIPAGAVALHDVTARDVVRGADIGEAPDVTAGTPVRVTVSTGAVSVTASAVALSDARVGDQIEVRMQRPTRTLRTRVIGPGAVLLEGS